MKLARVERSRRAAVIAAVFRALSEGVDIGEKRRCRGFIKAVEKVETFGDQFEARSLAETNRTRNSHIERRERMRHSAIATEIARRKNQIAVRVAVKQTAASLSAGKLRTGNAERSVRQHVRAVGLRRLIVIRVNICDDVERTTGRKLDNRRERKVGEDFLNKTL